MISLARILTGQLDSRTEQLEQARSPTSLLCLSVWITGQLRAQLAKANETITEQSVSESCTQRELSSAKLAADQAEVAKSLSLIKAICIDPAAPHVTLYGT